jgi:alpha-L-fucosidase
MMNFRSSSRVLMRGKIMRRLLATVLSLACSTALAAVETPKDFPSPVSDKAEPMQTGKFEPTWESLQQYQCPEWFRNAKFGLWAHWGPQCQPEAGDWYARNMYVEGSRQYKVHLQKYGHPSVFGFKDVINTWHAENWDPAKLMALYKRAGAQYFVALANHHDNFDNYDSKYQPWNAMKIGPKKDLIDGWAKAARDNGLRFGVSIHAARAWSWYEVAQGADKTGQYAGVQYDGKVTKADGAGKWWEGLDPQELYCQSHVPGARLEWSWDPKKGSSVPDQAYCDKFYNRTVDLINKYHPDLVYFDDTAIPLYPVSDAGLKIAAHFYNSNMRDHDGKLEAVMTNKVLTEDQKKCMVWDIERGQSNQIESFPWQTDTCIGAWHYDRSIYDRHRYKSTKTVIQTLCDIVSKNGNLLLNIPVRGDGTIDQDELAVVTGIADWMDVNRECIFDSRPWKVFGEGPATAGAAPIRAQGFNEGKGKPFTAEDVRFTTKGDTLYAIVMAWPEKQVQIKSLGTAAKNLDKGVTSVSLLGAKTDLKWKQSGDALAVDFPASKPCEHAFVLKIETAK